jgi:hypothetical protein
MGSSSATAPTAPTLRKTRPPPGILHAILNAIPRQASTWNNLLTCAEMLIIGYIHYLAFPYDIYVVEDDDDELRQRFTVGQALYGAISQGDVMENTAESGAALLHSLLLGKVRLARDHNAFTDVIMLGESISPVEAEKMFHEIDQDGNGVVKRAEAAIAVRYLTREILSHVEEAHFLDFDTLREMREKLFVQVCCCCDPGFYYSALCAGLH